MESLTEKFAAAMDRIAADHNLVLREVAVAVSGGAVIGEPAINSRGFVFDFHRDYNREIREVILRAIDG